MCSMYIYIYAFMCIYIYVFMYYIIERSSEVTKQVGTLTENFYTDHNPHNYVHWSFAPITALTAIYTEVLRLSQPSHIYTPEPDLFCITFLHYTLAPDLCASHLRFRHFTAAEHSLGCLLLVLHCGWFKGCRVWLMFLLFSLRLPVLLLFSSQDSA